MFTNHFFSQAPHYLQNNTSLPSMAALINSIICGEVMIFLSVAQLSSVCFSLIKFNA